MRDKFMTGAVLCTLCTAVMFCCLYSPPDARAQISDIERFIFPGTSKKISMDFKDASIKDVLKIFSQQSNLSFIASSDIAEKKVTLYFDDVPVEEALERLLYANNLTYEIQPGSNIFVVKARQVAPIELQTRVYPLKHCSVPSSKLFETYSIESNVEVSVTNSSSQKKLDGILGAIDAILSKNGTVVEDPRTNSLVVTDVPSQFPLIERTIARLDIPVPQILIEVEMLDISAASLDKIGFKFGESPLEFSGGTRSHIYPWNQNSMLDKQRFAFSDDEFTVGTIDASGLTGLLQFLRTETDTKSLARPRILTLNNETAQIKISTDEAIGVKTKSGASEGLATQSVEAERVETGVFLTVTPQASMSDGEILMAIEPRVIEARTGATFDGQTFLDPEERGSKSTLRVRTGDTIILGGLLRTEETVTITKLPILGDIPLLGLMFRHKNADVSERELMIFITPHIVRDSQYSNTQLPKIENITREQDVPSARLKQIQKELTHVEKGNL